MEDGKISLKQTNKHLQKKTLDSSTTPLKNQETRNTKSEEDCFCRICLSQCPNFAFCKCKGSTMIHWECLTQYLSKRQGNLANRLKCQICKYPFAIVVQCLERHQWAYGFGELRANFILIILGVLFRIAYVMWLVLNFVILHEKEIHDFQFQLLMKACYDFILIKQFQQLWEDGFKWMNVNFKRKRLIIKKAVPRQVSKEWDSKQVQKQRSDQMIKK